MKKPLAACAGALLAAAATVALGQIPTTSTTPEAPPIPLYQVEIIVFTHRDFDPNEERFADEAGPTVLDVNDPLRDVPIVEAPEPASAPVPVPQPDAPVGLGLPPSPFQDPLAIHILPPERLELGNEYRRLENLSAYRPLVHAAWIQPGLPDEQTKPFDLASIGVLNPSGTIRVYVSRFLHIVLDLTYRDGTSAASRASADELTELHFAPRYRLVTERQARSGELHYFDHPAFGVLVKVTPVPVDPEGASAGRRPAA
jgi:hypothetical protein